MSHSWKELGLRVPDILLPKEGTDMEKWAVVACDQYTSQPDYWKKVEDKVQDAPSTFRLMLPEYYLGSTDEEERIASIRKSMREYVENGTLRQMPKGCILVKRTCMGRSRSGLVIAVDLEAYDYSKGSSSLIRATEKTIVERIPPRLRIRSDAPMELPHILILIDDPEKTVIEPLFNKAGKIVYDTDLMMDGGHITGTFIEEESCEDIREAMSGLLERAKTRYGEDRALLMAMGDGNHSLATAKANWEQIRQKLTPEKRENHPARFALCELENIHDSGIVFEPIHRVLFGDGKADGIQMIQELVKILADQNGGASLGGKGAQAPEGGYSVPTISGGIERTILISDPVSGLEVGALQAALDILVQNTGLKIDYIHGEDTVRSLSREQDRVGFLLPPMDKFRLFPAVASDGALPRKTFSMGESNEKRYYIEARSLVND